MIEQTATEALDLLKKQYLEKPEQDNFLVKLAIALGILLITKLTLVAVERTIKRVSVQKFPGTSPKKVATVFSVVENVVRLIILFIAITLLLNLFGINTSSIIATAGIGGLAIALGAQGLVKDVLAGSFFLLEDQYNIGDYLTIGNITGTVEDITLRKTRIRDYNGAINVIPNSTIQQFTNYANFRIKSDIILPVPYSVSLEEIQKITEKISAECQLETGFFTSLPRLTGIKDLTEWNYLVQITAETVSGRQWEGQRLLRKKFLSEFQARGFQPTPPALGNSGNPS